MYSLTFQGLVLFGRDLSQIPCFRNSYLYGISSGIGCGLIFFLFTSRVKASMDFGMASFAVITLSYWAHCRYNYSKTKFEMQRVQEALKRKAMYEGTELDVEATNKTVDV